MMTRKDLLFTFPPIQRLLKEVACNLRWLENCTLIAKRPEKEVSLGFSDLNDDQKGSTLHVSSNTETFERGCLQSTLVGELHSYCKAAREGGFIRFLNGYSSKIPLCTTTQPLLHRCLWL